MYLGGIIGYGGKRIWNQRRSVNRDKDDRDKDDRDKDNT